MSVISSISFYLTRTVGCFVFDCISVLFGQISKCLGKNFQPNGHGVDAKDLAEKMQQLTTEVSKRKFIWIVFFSKFSWANQVLQTRPVSVFQRTEDAAEAGTSGSDSPADFFSQTPKEMPNFQIPVSSGKNHWHVMQLKDKYWIISSDWKSLNLYFRWKTWIFKVFQSNWWLLACCFLSRHRWLN